MSVYKEGQGRVQGGKETKRERGGKFEISKEQKKQQQTNPNVTNRSRKFNRILCFYFH